MSEGAAPPPRAALDLDVPVVERFVLVVDDTPEDAELVRRHLRRAAPAPWRLEFVQSGAHAVERVQRERPDCVLLDFHLPDMTGLEVLDALGGAEGIAVPVVMLTGSEGHVQVAVQAMQRGAQDYLFKDTLTAHALYRAVENAIERFAQVRLLDAQREELVRRNHALDAYAERTARALAEAERARAEAEAANAAKSKFLATMSHELRTPLNAIRGYAELLEMGVVGPVSEEQRAMLARIRKSESHLHRIISEILDFARLETGMGRTEFRPRAVRVADVLAEAGALVEPQLMERGIRAELAPPAAAAVAVWADPDRTRQIVVNLLSNAAKFTPPDGRVRVRVEAAERTVAVRVEDTGRGIPAGELEAVFEPFVQIGRDLNRPQEGTGLGLAISRELARGMGGELSAESEPGVGSTFTLVLPRAR